MAEAAADIGRAAHLPEQPRQAFGARRDLGRQERAELLGQVHQDRAGLEDPDRLGTAAVHQRRDLGVRVHRDEAAAELIAVADLDQPGVVLRALVAERQQLLEHDRDLDAVRRAQRIELQRVRPTGSSFSCVGAGDRAVDVGEPAEGGLVRAPRPWGACIRRGAAAKHRLATRVGHCRRGRLSRAAPPRRPPDRRCAKAALSD
jgi:hypothetical protein